MAPLRPIRFEQYRRLDGFVHAYSPGDETPVDVHRPGLYQEWPRQERTPFTEFAINNCEQEEMAVYFGLAWHLTDGLARYAIPVWYRDSAARTTGKPYELVGWEYRVDSETHVAAARKLRLVRALRSPSAPRLADVLDEGEMLIDITIGMDVGNWSRW